MLKKYKIHDNLNLLYYPTKKFKSFIIKICFFVPFDNKKITVRNLFKDVLMYENGAYDHFEILRERKKLYNIGFRLSSAQINNTYRYILTIKGTNPKYFEDEYYSISNILKYVLNFIFKPKLENGIFNNDIYELCLNRYKNDLKNMLQDKGYLIAYENTKLLRKRDNNNYFAEGYLEDFDDITNEEVYKQYLELLNSKILISAAGDLNVKELTRELNKYFYNFKEYTKKLEVKPTKYQKLKNKVIKLNTDQACLYMTFATEVKQFDENYFNYLIFSILLGEDTSSKLFRVIREEYGFSYDVYSYTEAPSGLLYVYMGLDYKNVKKAKELVFKQIEEIKEGKFSLTQLKMLINNNYDEVKVLYDNLTNTIVRESNLHLFGRNPSLKTLKESLNKVSKESIMEFAKKVKPISIITVKPKGDN